MKENGSDLPPVEHIRDGIVSLWLALAGFGLLALGDGLTKSTAGYWPGPAVAALRYSFGAIGLIGILWVTGGRSAFSFPRPWVQIGRGAAVAASTLCFFMAVQLLPLATATAVGFTTPMMTAILSALFLGEKAPLRVWGVSLLAFAGVLLVLQPSFAGLGARALLPLGSALTMALLMILNRAGADAAPPLLMQTLIASIAAPMLIAAALACQMTGLPEFAIGMPPLRVIAAAATVAVTATAGHWLIYLATIRATAALVAPTIYVQMLIAIVVGWFVFGDLPDAATLGGAALIIGAGLWLFRGSVRR